MFPHQADPESGVSGEQLFHDEIAGLLNEHVSRHFELWCCEYVRREGLATTVGAWWGNSLNAERRAGNRFLNACCPHATPKAATGSRFTVELDCWVDYAGMCSPGGPVL